ncbi:MAG: hypothetical protein ACE5MB_10840 [Anaerolineae bacterium]
MSVETAETIFWIIHIPLMVVFLAGLGLVFSIYLQGGVHGQTEAGTRQKVGFVIQSVLTTIFSRKLWPLIKAAFLDAYFNRHLFHTSKARWLSHFLLLSGFIMLVTLSGISALCYKLLIPLFHLEHVPWIAMWANMDHPVTALLNEIGAVLMTGGLLFFIVRRYLFRLPQLRTSAFDTRMVVLLGLILLSGWITEIVRLNSSHAEATAYFAFLGYPLAQLFRGLSIPWDPFYRWMYVGHGLFTSLVIIYIPFSKFMHVIAGGLTTVINTMEEEERRWREGGAGAYA